MLLVPTSLTFPQRGRCVRRARNWLLNWMELPEAASSRHRAIGRHESPSQHLEQEKYDEERTSYLESQGYKVIRFWNNDVMNNIEGVIIAINEVPGCQRKR